MNAEITSPTAKRESRWFSIPAIFAAFMFLTLLIRWLPAARVTAGHEIGMLQVIAGDLTLAWKCFLRCAVAYVLTAIAFDWLMPIRWIDAFLVAIGALIGELVVEYATAGIFGTHAGVTVQLIASALAYASTLLISLWILRRRQAMSVTTDYR